MEEGGLSNVLSSKGGQKRWGGICMIHNVPSHLEGCHSHSHEESQKIVPIIDRVAKAISVHTLTGSWMK